MTADNDDQPVISRAKRIEAARKKLADRYAAEPACVERFQAKMAKFAQAKKREQQRVDHLVLGKARPVPVLTRPKGMPKGEWKVERKRLLALGAELEPEIEHAMRLRELAVGSETPETIAAAAHHRDTFDQLQKNGTLDKEQVEWVEQIDSAHRGILADVAISIASLEARVDEQRNGAVVVERIHRVRHHLAYQIWRDRLPEPKQMILDMIVGDPIGYTVAAKRYRVGNLKAKTRLIDAIDQWPECIDRTFKLYSDDDIEKVRDAA